MVVPRGQVQVAGHLGRQRERQPGSKLPGQLGVDDVERPAGVVGPPLGEQ